MDSNHGHLATVSNLIVHVIAWLLDHLFYYTSQITATMWGSHESEELLFPVWSCQFWLFFLTQCRVFHSRIVSHDLHHNSCLSCEPCGWYHTITPQLPLSLDIPPKHLLPVWRLDVMSPSTATSVFTGRTLWSWGLRYYPSLILSCCRWH